MFGAKQLSVNRNTDSVVALTPNIELTSLLPIRSGEDKRQSNHPNDQPNHSQSDREFRQTKHSVAERQKQEKYDPYI